MKKLIISTFSTAILIFSFSCKPDCTPPAASSNCINPALIDSNAVCQDILAPVCGCNGVTYENACVADANGVTSYVPGECCQ